MADKEQLKLIVVYDRNRNEYSISKHNLNGEEAQRIVDEWNPHLTEGCSLMALNQTRRHRTVEAKDCRSCRDTVARSAGLDPKPKHVRREQ